MRVEMSMAKMKMSEVQTPQTAERSQNTQHKSQHKTDQIKRNHQDAFFLRGAETCDGETSPG